MDRISYRRVLLTIILLASVFLNVTASAPASRVKPFFISKAVTRVSADSFYFYQIQAKDSLGGIISIAVINLPGWLSLNAGENTVSGKAPAAGQYFIHIIAFNAGDTTHQRFMLTVYNRKTVNILTIGNSITNGTNRYNSYRRPLWQLLHKEDYNFDFIGSWDKHHMGADVPDPDFDMDHDGHSGWRFDDLFHPPAWDTARGNINTWLETYFPGLVLLELGTNDVFQCRKVSDMLKDLDRLIKLVRRKNKRVKIFLAQIPPLGKEWAQKKLCGDSISYDSSIRNLNQAFAGFAARQSKKHSPVVIVNQYTGIDTDTDTYDDIHPNDTGEKKVAVNWFNAIRQYLHKLQE